MEKNSEWNTFCLSKSIQNLLVIMLLQIAKRMIRKIFYVEFCFYWLQNNLFFYALNFEGFGTNYNSFKNTLKQINKIFEKYKTNLPIKKAEKILEIGVGYSLVPILKTANYLNSKTICAFDKKSFLKSNPLINPLRIFISYRIMVKFIFHCIVVAVILWIVWFCISAMADDRDYMLSNWLTTGQAEKVLELSKTTRNPDHYIKWFTAIQAHEQGAWFVDGKTKYLAGRLKKWMEYKDFNTQLEDWTKAYNKYWYKNNTASDWIYKSKYCVSDTHWGGQWCPNRQKNVPLIAKGYYETNQIIKNKQPSIIRKKRICRSIVINIDKWEYIQLSFGGKIRQIIKELRYGDELRICKDV